MKKGVISAEVLVWLYRLLMLVFVVMFIYLIINAYLTRSIDTNYLEASVLFSRLIYGNNCILYNNEIKDQPGILDLNKITENDLNKCFSIKNRDIGFDVKLLSDDGQVLKDVIINKDFFDLNVACNIKRSRVYCDNFRDYILYYDGTEFLAGVLTFEVVIANEQKR
ncbi:hypothetical protein HYX18_03345 [Candidatus Woesearchaeota archaeon]|nr:hypothetical protein [Candidatus Woesearchaeota archaeon]